MKPFKELEILVARIQQQLAPDAKIEHDVKLQGRVSERKRQIDVLLSYKIGQYDIRIVIDCKDYKHPVDVKAVEEFNGLIEDVGAHKGVLVSPSGFTAAAKTVSDKKQIDLYSPIDTDVHKWTCRVTIPAVCDHREAAISFGMRFNSPYPARFPKEFHNKCICFDTNGKQLGLIIDAALEKWNSGRFPIEPGEYHDLPVFDEPEVYTDNGYGISVPVEISTQIKVTKTLYFGQYPLSRFSGFRDEVKGKVISNAIEFGLIDPVEVEKTWLRIADLSEAPTRPVIIMTGLIGSEPAAPPDGKPHLPW